MMNSEERSAEVKQRIKIMEKQRQQRRNRRITLSSFACCIAVVVAMAVLMPQLTKNTDTSIHANLGTAASIFANNGALGYILIGLLAFVLGVAVTAFCFRLHKYHKDTRDPEDGDA